MTDRELIEYIKSGKGLPPIRSDYIRTGKHDCDTCLRQACEYKNETIRVNCPLWKESAV